MYTNFGEFNRYASLDELFNQLRSNYNVFELKISVKIEDGVVVNVVSISTTVENIITSVLTSSKGSVTEAIQSAIALLEEKRASFKLDPRIAGLSEIEPLILKVVKEEDFYSDTLVKVHNSSEEDDDEEYDEDEDDDSDYDHDENEELEDEEECDYENNDAEEECSCDCDICQQRLEEELSETTTQRDSIKGCCVNAIMNNSNFCPVCGTKITK